MNVCVWAVVSAGYPALLFQLIGHAHCALYLHFLSEINNNNAARLARHRNRLPLGISETFRKKYGDNSPNKLLIRFLPRDAMLAQY